MSNWIPCLLGDVLKFQRGFDITKKEQTEGIIPIVSSSGVNSYHNEFKVTGPGVIIGRKGTLGTVHYIKGNYWPHDTTLWIKDFKSNNPRFLYYFLKTMKLENLDSGSSNPTLNRNHLHKIKIKFPKLPLQKKIAAILTTYYELIEINNQRIQSLEKMAEEIYREWFVRLRFSNYEKSKFIKGIPDNWSIRHLSEFITFQKGIEPGSANYLDYYDEDYIPFLRVGDLNKRESNIYINKHISKGIFCNEDDILISFDGTVGLVKFGLSGCYSSGIRKVKFKNKILPKWYVYFLLKSDTIQSVIYQHATGSTILHASSAIKHLKFLFSSEDLLSRFNKIISPIFEKIIFLRKSNDMLFKSRDILLPRLISGKLSVENLDIKFPPSMEEVNA